MPSASRRPAAICSLAAFSMERSSASPAIAIPPRSHAAGTSSSMIDLGFDCSKDFHVFALDWVENKPIWLVDGKPIKQTYYEWTEPGAHLVVASSI